MPMAFLRQRRVVSRRHVDAIVQVAFVASGAAGLIFELVWVYWCGLLLGNTVWAASIVLSSFMAGLALGNALAGRYGHRLHHPFAVYAAIEAIVAVTGIGLTYLMIVLPAWLAPATHTLLDTRWPLNLVRAVAAFTLLVIPTTAMGATLPVVVSGLSRSPDRFGGLLGRLYGLNTLGAVAGVLAAQLILIDRLGTIGSAWIAALLDAAAAGGALWAASAAGSETPPPLAGASHLAPAFPASRVDRVREVPTAAGWLLACAFVIGAAAMALEVVWFRFLSMFLLASTLAVSTMLAVVLSAMAIGALIASRWLSRDASAPAYLPAVAWVAGCSVVGSFAAFGALAGARWSAEWPRMAWAAVALTSATATASSVSFVLLAASLRRRTALADASAAGWLTLANTAGGMTGPLVAAFGLLPAIGMERSLFALAASYGVAGLIALPAVDRSRPARRVTAAAAGAVLAALVLFPFGTMNATYFPQVTASYAEDGSRVVATREGIGETIHLMAKSWLDTPLYYRLVTNGFSMSGTHPTAKRYMRYFAYWPLVVRAAPLRRALVVCYGVGVTTAAVASIRSIASIDVVEISPDVVAMSAVIYPRGDRPLDDPRVRLHLEDGRYFLQAARDTFDLITGEPPPPLTPGAVSLYTREYFTLMRDRLADGGVVTYWLPAARRGEYDVRAIVAAFCNVFDDCSLWNGTVFDWMLVGTRRLSPNATAASFARPWQDPVVWPQLREIGFEVPQEIGATFLGDREDLRQLAAGAAPLTDDHPDRLRPRPTRLALTGTPTAFERDASDFVARVTDPSAARHRFARSALIRRLWPESLAAETLPYFDTQAAINRVLWEGPNPLRRIAEIHELLTHTTLRRVPLWALGSDDAQQAAVESAPDDSGAAHYALGIRALVARRYQMAAESFAAAEQRGVRLSTVRPLLIYSLCLAGDLENARRLATTARSGSPDERHFWKWLAGQFGVHAAPESAHE
jgi:spermidine synthase